MRRSRVSLLRKKILLSFFVVVTLISLASPAFAAPGTPRIINIQGRLMNASGALLGGAGTEYCFQFSFYDSAVTGSGTKLWPVGAPSAMTVSVRNGIYNAGIGDTTAGGDTLDFNFQDTDTAYLNVEVATQVGGACGGGDESFETLSPRQRILAAGYAINASMLGGRVAAQDATGNQIPVLSAGQLVLGSANASINATSSNALTLQGGGQATGDIQFFSSANRVTAAGDATFAGSVSSGGVSTTNATATNLTVTGGFLFGSGNGVLKAVAGVVSAALLDLTEDVIGILGIANGGTGTSTAPSYGQLLVGNAVGGYDLIATSSLGIIGGGTGVVNAGAAARLAFYAADGDEIDSADGLVFDDVNNRLGIGSPTPDGKLSIHALDGETNLSLFRISSSTASATTTLFDVDNTGQVTVGGLGQGGDANFQFASDANAWSIGYFAGDKSFRFASSTNLSTNVALSLGKDGTAEFFGGVRILTLPGCTQALETDENGNIVCGTDVQGGGAGGGWATTTNSLATHPTDPSDVVLVGQTATTTTGNILEVGGASLLRGTLTAYNTVTAPIFSATSTSATSTMPRLSTNALTLGSDYLTSVAGSGLLLSGGVLSATLGISVDLASAEVTGILGIASGGTGTSTAPTYGQVLVGNAAGGYDLIATSSLGIVGGGTGFSTTSADYWQSERNFFSTTSTDYWKTANNFFSTSSADFYTSVTNFFSSTSAEYFTHSSTSIPKTYTANAFTALQTFENASTTNISAVYASSTQGFFGALSIGSLTGLLRATDGTISATMLDLANDVSGILSVANGGTGTSTAPTYGQFLVGNAAGGYDFRATSTLAIALEDTTGILEENRGGTGQTTYALGDILYASGAGQLMRLPIGSSGEVLKVTGGIPAWGVDLSGGGGGGIVGAWSTTTNELAIYPANTSHIVMVGSGSTSTVNSIFEVTGRSYFSTRVGIATTSPGSLLAIGDVANFGVDGSTIYTPLSVGELSVSSALNAATANITGLATIQNASTTVFSSHYASSTEGYFGTLSIGALTGVLKASAGTVTASLLDLSNEASGILGVANGGTGTSTAPTSGQLLVGNAAGGYDLVATSSLGLAGEGQLDGFFSLSAWYATTTDGLAQGITNRYYSDSLVNTFLGASTTVPKTYEANTFTNSNTFSGSLLFTGNTTASSIFASSFGSSAFGVGTVATTTLQGNVAGTSTIQGFVNVLGTNSTSTFSGGLAAARLNLTATNATSTSASGFNLTGGCFAINGTCLSSGVTMVSNSDSTLTVSPTSGNVVVSLNLANANVWTGLQRFGNASTTAASALDFVTVGRTATTTIRGEANATSTFAGGVSATRVNTSATSTLAGVRLTNLTSCAEALETDASGNIICGNDAGVDGVTVTTFVTTGSNTWTKANYPNLSFTQVIVTAGGGGGGGAIGSGTNEAAGGGGGAGGTTISMIPTGSLGATVSAVVGAAGAGGTNAVNGGTGINSSFGTHASSTGGGGGTSDTTTGVCNNVGVSGLGGATTTAVGDIKIRGGDGDVTSCATEAANGGNGGSSYWGGGGKGFGSNLAEVGAGVAGASYGSGGGGGSNVDTNNNNGVGGRGADGVIVTMNYTSSGADLAEWYETEGDVEVGDIVAIGGGSYEYDSKLGLQKSSVLAKATSRSSVVGVVSTAPSETIGYDIFSTAGHPQPIALAGRVPVKVSLENGDIKAGDLLTISSIPGVAMRATKAGVTIGKALEDAACASDESSATSTAPALDSDTGCTVLVIVNTSYTTGALLNVAFRDLGMESDMVSTELDYSKMILAEMLQQKKNITASTTLSEMLTDRLAAGLEVITPRVVTDTLVASVVQPLESDVRIQLADGKFVIERLAQASTTVSFDTASSSASTTPVLSVDALGNAIFAGALTATDIIVGSPEKPGGITMYDTDTGEPYCARIVYGRLETFAGTCAELADFFEETKPEDESEPEYVPSVLVSEPSVTEEESADEPGGEVAGESTSETVDTEAAPEETESEPVPQVEAEAETESAPAAPPEPETPAPELSPESAPQPAPAPTPAEGA